MASTLKFASMATPRPISPWLVFRFRFSGLGCGDLRSPAVICFLTGAFFTEAALLAAVYVVFLAFCLSRTVALGRDQAEFGFFVNHFTFLAGLLFAAVHGPGQVLALRWSRSAGLKLVSAPGKPPRIRPA